MNKLKAQPVRDRFDGSISRLEGMLGRVAGLTADDRKFLVESSLLSASVLWEAFVHDLFVVYINLDPSRLGRTLLTSIQQSTKDKRGQFVSSHVRLEWPKHLNRDQVLEVLDQEERNVSFKSAQQMVERAKEWLGTTDAQRFDGLSDAELAAIDLWGAVRNYLAHRSRSAKKTMDAALAKGQLDARLRRGPRKKADVGAHFCAAVPGASGERRIEVLLDVMKQVASKL